MATNDAAQQFEDARSCPKCGCRGILPLDQPRDERGRIKDPVMICPVCEDEFRATGVIWLGAFKPPDQAAATDDKTRQWAEDVARVIVNRAQDPDEEAPDGSPIQDPSPAAPNLPAADTANSAQSHLMVEQEHLDTDDLFHLLAEVTCSGDNKVGSTLPDTPLVRAWRARLVKEVAEIKAQGLAVDVPHN